MQISKSLPPQFMPCQYFSWLCHQSFCGGGFKIQPPPHQNASCETEKSEALMISIDFCFEDDPNDMKERIIDTPVRSTKSIMITGLACTINYFLLPNLSFPTLPTKVSQKIKDLHKFISNQKNSLGNHIIILIFEKFTTLNFLQFTNYTN